MKKQIITILIIFLPWLVMSQGVSVIDMLEQKNNGTFAIVDSKDLLGGAVSGDTSDVHADRMRVGMLVLDTTDGAVYQLDSDSVWRTFAASLWVLSQDTNLNYCSGRVGIGDNTPDYKLDVIGDVNTEGNFLIDGVVTIRRKGSNMFIGNAGNDDVLGIQNFAMGDLAGKQLDTADYNTVMGYQSMYYNAYGHHNTVVGFKSAWQSREMQRSTIIGSQTCNTIQDTIWYNTSLGALAGNSASTADSSIWIGYNQGNENGQIIISNNATALDPYDFAVDYWSLSTMPLFLKGNMDKDTTRYLELDSTNLRLFDKVEVFDNYDNLMKEDYYGITNYKIPTTDSTATGNSIVGVAGDTILPFKLCFTYTDWKMYMAHNDADSATMASYFYFGKDTLFADESSDYFLTEGILVNSGWDFSSYTTADLYLDSIPGALQDTMDEHDNYVFKIGQVLVNDSTVHFKPASYQILPE